ncbi:methionyl-tRNA formyltransferase [Actinosynnema pretiosum subsp. pretiosum]|uniref:Methionyl-tRNA formyltransferase n=1 Tax=Actinosynnema pretiosum subsp. pretiosum TaxID=103721 RepID=A0AA45L4X7_9PSEU|nr:Methionyl-tRNA formyltransferase [Actinosynnema pretiosum subsp. pretiosum]QUF03471.1 methionyl-tRNA formyltransferase [Actinosynnema pretiosum subsp. pretiosum]
MRLVFAGTPEPALPSLRALLASDRHEVVAVVTRPDAPTGRGRKVERSPVAALAEERGIEVLTPAKAGDPDFLARLAELAPDLCPVVAYGALLPAKALAIPTHGWVNLHFSLLPAWRGAAPVQASVRHGDDITGASTFRIVKELDAGPVFGVVTERVGERDTAGDLLGRLAESGARLLLSTVDGIEDGTLRAVEQSPEGVSHAPKISVEDARLDFTTPATALDRLARAVTPEPGAWAQFRGERLKLGPVAPVEDPVEPLAPGQIKVERKRVLVGTATHPVRLGEVQAQGKKRMAATDWARGVRIEPGERIS